MGCSKFRQLLRNIRYLTRVNLSDEFENQIVYQSRKITDDLFYGYEDYEKIHNKPLKVLDDLESKKALAENPKSFVRFGDGEIKLMMGIDQPFQKYDPILVERLKQILHTKRDDLYVALNRAYFSPLSFMRDNENYVLRYGYDFRQFFLKNCDVNNTYLDACFTIKYITNEANYDIESHFAYFKNMFKDKDIVIVSGEGVIEKLQYDIFDTAKSKRIIHGPARHAWTEHDKIIEEIKSSVSKNSLICMILGMAGKAMVPELTDMGYMVWDIGHAAKDYDAYMKQIPLDDEAKRMEFYAPD